MTNNPEIRGGVLQVTGELFREILTDFATGKYKIVNKNLALRDIRKNDLRGDIWFKTYYEILFTADDLPIIPEGSFPNELDVEKIDDKTCKLIAKY